MAVENVNISVADDFRGRLDEVVAGGERVGLRVRQRLDSIGVLTGSIDSAQIPALERVPGVSRVERERRVQLPPPESRVQ
jgi:hypothetical protein